MRVVVVEATPVLRRDGDAHVRAREDDEGQGRGPRWGGPPPDSAEGGEGRDQVERAQRDRERGAQRRVSDGPRDAGHDRPRRPAEIADVGQHGLEPHGPARRRHGRPVRHAVEPVRQAAERERGQRREKPRHQRAKAAAQEKERDGREVDEREEVGPEREPEARAEQREQERRAPALRGGRAKREDEREGSEEQRQRVVIARLVGPEQEEVRRQRQERRSEQRRPGPEGVVGQAHGEPDGGQREEHGQELERPRRRTEEPEERRGEVAVQRAHERLAEEVDGQLAPQHRQAQQARRRLVVPEPWQPEQQDADGQRAGEREGQAAGPGAGGGGDPRGDVARAVRATHGPTARGAPGAAASERSGPSSR